MSQSEPVPGSSLEPAPGADAEPLGHLYRMSATAGVATTDYAAINTTAIVAIVLGVAAVLALFSSLLLIIPLLGAICGALAIRQIRNSNGTQVGGFLAWGGLLLSLGIGGGVFGYQAIITIHARGNQREIAQVMEQMGQDIHDGNYDAAYANCSDRFRERVSADLFATRLRELSAVPQLGKLVGFEWNQEPMIFETNPDSQIQTATAMAFERMEKLTEPEREVMVFVREGGHWKLSNLPRIFPAEKPHS